MPHDVPAAVDLPRYCARIGYAGPLVPTWEVLAALQAAHIAAIPFEALGPLTGKGVDLDPAAVDAKLIDGGRGGYCFEQNSLFLRVLRAIGFDAEGRIARVRWMLPDDAPPTPRTHQMTRVMLDGQAWLVDVGFGSAVPLGPLAMDTAEVQPTPHERYRIAAMGAVSRLEADLGGTWTALYDFEHHAPPAIDYEVGNWYTATHPASHFTHQLMVARTTVEARYALGNNRLTIRRPGHEAEQHILSADGIAAALSEHFGLAVEPGWRAAIERAAAVEVVEPV